MNAIYLILMLGTLAVLFHTQPAGGATKGNAVIWLEAETFAETGKWSNDSQHVDLMGSPYLLATGVGKPVADAATKADIPAAGKYRLWVRCRDWLPAHSPGQFQVLVGGKTSNTTFGKAETDAWQWVDGGQFDLPAGEVEVRLHDLTGWFSRCDAVVLAAGEFTPAGAMKALAAQRLAHCGVSPKARATGPYDLVVVGGGPAGIGAALGAARNGCKVALVQDRPVLGGNASSEISIPPMGYIGNPPDKVNVTGIAEEIFPRQGWHAFADSARIERIVRAEKNITLLLNTRATGVEMAGPDKIKTVQALDVRTGQRLTLAAPLFADCTGHGWVGFYAGAEYRQGQEARAEFDESLAPIKAGKRTMGNSLYKATIVDRGSNTVAAAPGEIVKYSDKKRVTIAGQWTRSTFNSGDYLHDGNTDRDDKTVTFSPSVAKAGQYEVFLGYRAMANRATNVPVTVAHAEGKTTVTVDQTGSVAGWARLGAFNLTTDGPASVTVSAEGANGYVIADCVRIAPEGAVAPAPPADNVPFKCPPWAYQWKESTDFEPRGSHRRIRQIRRPENFDVPSRGKGRNPGDSIDGAIRESWWIEYGGVVDTIADAEKIRDELLRITLGMWNYAKNHNPKTIERNKRRELVWVNYVPGIRESRRLMGDYVMRQSDFDDETVHPDTVAFTDWGIDVHHPEGFWVRGNDCIHVYGGRRVSIPYRSLYSRNIANLLMAGRCHSATHIALGGTRVIRPMCATGQAAGTAAAIATKRGTDPRGVYKSHTAELQQTLLKDGCYLLGITNADTADLARTAKATASSAAEGGDPSQAIDGWNRVLGKDRNAWAPAANHAGPHWIQLTLPTATQIDTVHVTAECRGVGLTVQTQINGVWKTIADAASNTARRRVIGFPAVTTDAIRVLPAGRLDRIGICEIRLYCEGDRK